MKQFIEDYYALNIFGKIMIWLVAIFVVIVIIRMFTDSFYGKKAIDLIFSIAYSNMLPIFFSLALLYLSLEIWQSGGGIFATLFFIIGAVAEIISIIVCDIKAIKQWKGKNNDRK